LSVLFIRSMRNCVLIVFTWKNALITGKFTCSA
jgi:hypothetical protein